jgi:glycolate oxidase
MKKIRDILPGRVSTEPDELYCYGYDASSETGRPVAVVRPLNVDEVSKIARFASENKVPIVPRGAGSGMTGGSVPLDESIVLSLEGMNRIIDVDERNMIATVEPGVINGQLQNRLETMHLFYPPDPSSMDFCTIGGNIAENAGGPRAIKYGVTRDYVLGLEVVLADGTVITSGGTTLKGVVGYDLTSLFVGSEGTLGIVTKAFLKLLPLPDEIATLLCSFSQLDKAARAVPEIIAAGITPRVLEFMDQEAILAIEQYRPVGLPHYAEALLLIEVDGPRRQVLEEAEKTASVCKSLGASVRLADDVFSRRHLWEARRALSPALYHIKPTKINEDIVVPRTKIPDMIETLRNISRKYDLKIVTFGHAGDGNIHVNIMTDKEDRDEYRRAKDAVKDVFEATLNLQGTISGEHGIGLTKAPYLGMELSDASINLMKGIKKIFDPGGILNPGKIFSSD